MDAARKLFAIRAIHTLVWAFFASCIVAIPIAAWRGRLGLAAILIAIVLAEVVVLALNSGRCPLTPVAARYTPDRTDNFDIFLPAWLARHNKAIFGTLFIAGIAWTALVWAGVVGAG